MPKAVSLIDRHCFRFFGVEGDLRDVGWSGGERSDLWRYNEHYFDDLNAADAETRADWHSALLDQWCRDNPRGSCVGWDPYPTSLRIINWIKYSLAGRELTSEHLFSLGNQIEWLSHRIERHLLGNHVIANAKALYFGGCFFSGNKPSIWLAKAREIFAYELCEQVLEDGGHFELSPMYHSVVLEDLLDLINIATAYGHEKDVKCWREISPKMFSWLDCMCHPDGGLSFFNDAAFGVAADKNELLAYAARLELPEVLEASKPRHLIESGYARLENEKAVLVCDIGNVGPDYIPGHAHADTLSFEMSVYGQRLFVNSGTSEYGLSSERGRQRGTRAHNTVSVNGRNSSEVWGGFRVGRRARPISPSVVLDSEFQQVSCAHNGFSELFANRIHTRTWKLSNDSLDIWDEVSGAPCLCEVFFYCHPDIRVKGEGGSFYLTLSNDEIIFMEIFEGQAFVEPSSWHPRFGVSLPNTLIRVELESNWSQVRVRF